MENKKLYYCTENRKVYDIEDIMNFYAYDNGGYNTFKEYLNSCLDKNGSLREYNPETMLLDTFNNEVIFKSEVFEETAETLAENIATLFCDLHISSDDYMTTCDEIKELLMSFDTSGIALSLEMVDYKDTSDEDKETAENFLYQLETFTADFIYLSE